MTLMTSIAYNEWVCRFTMMGLFMCYVKPMWDRRTVLKEVRVHTPTLEDIYALLACLQVQSESRTIEKQKE